MLNNYSSSRDQSSIDWTPQAFNTERRERKRERKRESWKAKIGKLLLGPQRRYTCGLARKRKDKKMYPLGELRLAFVTVAGDPFERSDNGAAELVRERCQRRSRWYLSVLRRLIDRPEFNVCKAPSLSGGFQSELFISHVIKKFWHAWLPLIFRARVSCSLLSAILPQAFSASLAQISGIVQNQIVVTMWYSRIWYWMSWGYVDEVGQRIDVFKRTCLDINKVHAISGDVPDAWIPVCGLGSILCFLEKEGLTFGTSHTLNVYHIYLLCWWTT